MEKFFLTLLLFSAVSFNFSLSAQTAENDSTGMDGDNFSLETALAIFKKSSSIEEFEKLLNTESEHVNNLDLNDDGEADYIRVTDKVDGDNHAIILQAAISEKENQDIAVIGVEKKGAEEAYLQIIGDEDLYGKDYIYEPQEEKASGKGGPFIADIQRVWVNVWFWSPVRFIFAPAYRPWVSPWRFRVYPPFFRPWRPLAWRSFYGFRAPHRVGFFRAPHLRVNKVHKFYRPGRTRATVINTRRHTVVKKGGHVRVHHKHRGGRRR
jgi:hypothetical protein